MKSVDEQQDLIDALAQNWADSGIEKGDAVLVHSDLKALMRRFLREKKRVDAGLVLKSFEAAVGSAGTLLFPLFNFEFTKGVSFDVRATPSHMGALSEAARLDRNAVRTGHPIYSFAALGAQAHRFAGVDNVSGYGPDSPFALLREMDGKIAILDLPDQQSMTFYHHVEESLNVPYRYHKSFTGSYTDARGVTAPKTYGLFVRSLEQGVQTHVNLMGELLWQKGLYRGSRPNEGTGLRVTSARALFDATADVIRSGRALGLLYRIEKQGSLQ